MGYVYIYVLYLGALASSVLRAWLASVALLRVWPLAAQATDVVWNGYQVEKREVGGGGLTVELCRCTVSMGTTARQLPVNG